MYKSLQDELPSELDPCLAPQDAGPERREPWPDCTRHARQGQSPLICSCALVTFCRCRHLLFQLAVPGFQEAGRFLDGRTHAANAGRSWLGRLGGQCFVRRGSEQLRSGAYIDCCELLAWLFGPEKSRRAASYERVTDYCTWTAGSRLKASIYTLSRIGRRCRGQPFSPSNGNLGRHTLEAAKPNN